MSEAPYVSDNKTFYCKLSELDDTKPDYVEIAHNKHFGGVNVALYQQDYTEEEAQVVLSWEDTKGAFIHLFNILDQAGKEPPVPLNYLVVKAHENAVSKGWWEEERSFGEVIALIHSEASEALEDFRNGHEPTEEWYEIKEPGDDGGILTSNFQNTDNWKPCGVPSELADIVIRVFDACGKYGIDLEKAVREKMAYNATRPHRHGGKKL